MRPAGRGLFVAFEGGDGTGKTTQCRLLVDALRARGVAVVATREPGGTALGDRVRDLLLHSGIDIGPMAEALLFAAARAQHVTEVIAPALARGETVVCDRFLGSSLVYQGIGLGLGMETVRAVNELATAGVLPDVTVVLDVPVEESLRRKHADGELPDTVESRGSRFHERVREGYRGLGSQLPGRVAVLDGTGPVGEVHGRVCAIIDAALRGYGTDA
ncbi:MAG TPA: dTMP kinase [Armatimonadota bacterium]|nr:dTMP kinase [Armatimonadota bacterium]